MIKKGKIINFKSKKTIKVLYYILNYNLKYKKQYYKKKYILVHFNGSILKCGDNIYFIKCKKKSKKKNFKFLKKI
ncbi:30S ribosomal protein S17 [Candidatus Vidania fulgoroideae]|nr:30S ribosomal protein S17 [Candidatus Vidania fulgoroideae]WDR79239.1 30S ribosomal protein S17 [Candidatus Vidania fulgoroideae]